MGCNQTTTQPPSLVVGPSPITPIYVKSALKTPRVNNNGRVEKRSATKRNASTVNKSVNFDEKVRVKLRTPTPKQTRYMNRSSLSKIGIKPTSNHDDGRDDNDDDIDDEISISSQDDIQTGRLKSSALSLNSSLQRNQPNGFLQKTNSVTSIPSENKIKRKTTPPLVRPPPSTIPTRSPSVPPLSTRPPPIPSGSVLSASSVITPRPSPSLIIPPQRSSQPSTVATTRPFLPPGSFVRPSPPPSTAAGMVPRPLLPPPSAATRAQPRPSMPPPPASLSTGISSRPPMHAPSPSLSTGIPPRPSMPSPSIGVSSQASSLVSPITMSTPIYSEENPLMLSGNRFRVRRKVPYSASPQIPSSINATESSPASIHRLPSQTIPASVQRPSSNTDTILIEHPTSIPNENLLPLTNYYSLTRQPPPKNTSMGK